MSSIGEKPFVQVESHVPLSSVHENWEGEKNIALILLFSVGI